VDFDGNGEGDEVVTELTVGGRPGGRLVHIPPGNYVRVQGAEGPPPHVQRRHARQRADGRLGSEVVIVRSGEQYRLAPPPTRSARLPLGSYRRGYVVTVPPGAYVLKANSSSPSSAAVGMGVGGGVGASHEGYKDLELKPGHVYVQHA
jgi:hypothetical protein